MCLSEIMEINQINKIEISYKLNEKCKLTCIFYLPSYTKILLISVRMMIVSMRTAIK